MIVDTENCHRYRTLTEHCLSGAWQTGIRTVLSTISSSSCLRFVENGNGADYLIFDRNEGCHSPVGRLGGAQEVSIGYGCESVSTLLNDFLKISNYSYSLVFCILDEFVLIETFCFSLALRCRVFCVPWTSIRCHMLVVPTLMPY